MLLFHYPCISWKLRYVPQFPPKPNWTIFLTPKDCCNALYWCSMWICGLTKFLGTPWKCFVVHTKMVLILIEHLKFFFFTTNISMFMSVPWWLAQAYGTRHGLAFHSPDLTPFEIFLYVCCWEYLKHEVYHQNPQRLVFDWHYGCNVSTGFC